MKIIPFLFFVSFFNFNASSQASKEEERPYYYLGEHDSKHLYIKSLFSQIANEVMLYELNDNEIIESEKISIQNALIHQLYCDNEIFYAITSTPNCEKFFITSFDKFLKEKESVEILSLTNSQIRGLKSGDYSMKFYHQKNRAALAMIDNEITICSINFSSLASKTFKLPTGLNKNFISDIYLEEDLNLFISRRDELFHFKNGELQIPEINHSALQGDIDSWRFVANDSDPYLVSMITKGGILKGFAYCPLSNGALRPNECILKQEKAGSKSKMPLSYNSFVKAEISDSKLFVTVQRIEQAINETIMISCIDLSANQNTWNFQVLSIHDAPYIWKENQNSLNRASFSFIEGDKLIFFFNAAVKKLNPEHFFETDKRVITYDISIQTTIIKSEININTGENDTKPLHEDYKSESFKIFNSSYHLDGKKKLHFITYKEYNNRPYDQQLKPEKKVEVIQL